jgi:hypothetical protein
MSRQPEQTLEDALRARVDRALADLPYARRTLFGVPCFCAGSHLFAFLWEGTRVGLAFRDEDDALALRSLPGAEPWFPSRSRGAVPNAVLLPTGLTDDDEALARWLQRAHAQAVTTPPQRR